ncbi:hypothetical protein BGY98DRAFT_178108 [Russula aff. rugulosa BPL654]|nr:hypothetical protein BGY98DRAFT_178108 [Russula aff. rugulosa BPL654]
MGNEELDCRDCTGDARDCGNGPNPRQIPMEKCTLAVCTHKFSDSMEESSENYDAGFDPRSPPWTLPIVPSTSSADSRPTPLGESRRSASAQGGTNARPSYLEPSPSPVEDGEGERKRKRHNGSDVSEHERPPPKKPKKPKKSKADLRDESYEPPTGARKEVNAQAFLQQTWAEAVRNNCTIMVMHSGNHEIIGIRHRETQTLYISHVIEPHSCSNPAYGKIQVGIYIAAIQETIDRAKQDIEAKEKRAHDPPADTPLKNEEPNPDADLDDYSPKGPTRSNKRSRGSSSKGKGKGRRGGNAKRHASGKVIDDHALLANAVRQNRLCLRFFYDIYDSPHPATFRRIHDEPKEALGPAEPPTPPLSPGRETTPPPAPSIHITVQSELQPGSTGIVHIGTMAVGPSGPTAKVAVKLAFSRDEKSQLMEEHRVYSHLHSRGVQGIPRDIGLFVDGELLLGAEGPYALVMTYAGVSLFRRQTLALDSAKDSLLATLTSIHRANILHGDIRLANLCITPSGEAFVLDFSHATESRSRKEKLKRSESSLTFSGWTRPQSLLPRR